MKNIKQVHLVYPIGNKISTPDTIGRHLQLALEKYYQVKKYNYDEIVQLIDEENDQDY